ncbi:MAG: isochorismatase [Planctomycetota bacterium]|nr:isochorismatase [Planctomycetota bacterium]
MAGSYSGGVTTPFVRREPYAPRNHRFSGLLHHAGWTLRRHDITPAGAPMEVPTLVYAPGEALSLSLLPAPAATRDRPGLGFLIRHPGINQHYIILAWWDNQNELITHVLVRSNAPDGTWVDARGQYSFCVWDLEVFTRERERYVQFVLTPAAGPQIDRYLAD